MGIVTRDTLKSADKRACCVGLYTIKTEDESNKGKSIVDFLNQMH